MESAPTNGSPMRYPEFAIVLFAWAVFSLIITAFFYFLSVLEPRPRRRQIRYLGRSVGIGTFVGAAVGSMVDLVLGRSDYPITTLLMTSGGLVGGLRAKRSESLPEAKS